MGLKVLAAKLKEMREYLERVVDGTFPYNQSIVNNF